MRRTLIPFLATHGARRLHRLVPDALWRLPATRRTAYLTFDDGPTRNLTPAILDTLAKHEARAAFFLIGHHAERNRELVRSIVEGGHVLGNHTYTHPDPWRVPEAVLWKELEATTALLEDLSGREVRWLRPPYGHISRLIRRWCLERGQRLTMWDVMPGDYISGMTSARIVSHLVRNVRPGSVIVLHDNPRCARFAAAALDTFLGRFREQGWRFDLLPEGERRP